MTPDSSMKRSEFTMPMVKDPVCGMEVDPQKTTQSSTYQGETYYFCSPGCKKAFDKEPEKYTGKTGSSHSEHHH
jgi:YHS domain-containing protein